MDAKCIYEIKEDKTARLMRAYGENGIIFIPGQIDGIPVTEVGAYCFAPANPHLKPERLLPAFSGKGGNEDLLCELSGKAVLEIYLPDTVTRIGNNAFYNCAKMQKISIPHALEEVGSDVFMNCICLEEIYYRGDITKKSCLKQILAQISWNVEVSYGSENEYEGMSSGTEAEYEGVFFFPEFFEGYDEIGPAHIFELNISGEGFRARQSFRDGEFVITEYDDIFLKALAEEPERNLFRIASNRICYPVGLTEEHKTTYASYLKEHQNIVEKLILLNDHLDTAEKRKQLEYLLQEGCMDRETLSRLTLCASENGMAELSVYLMKWKKRYFASDAKNRYDFADV